MKVKCTNCGAEHVLKDEEVTRHARVQFNCSKCGKPTVVDVKLKADATIVMSPLPSFARTGLEGTASELGMPDATLALPPGGETSGSVIERPEKRLVRKIEKASLIVGRQGAD